MNVAMRFDRESKRILGKTGVLNDSIRKCKGFHYEDNMVILKTSYLTCVADYGQPWDWLDCEEILDEVTSRQRHQLGQLLDGLPIISKIPDHFLKAINV